jgi:DDE superfamily endonuclease
VIDVLADQAPDLREALERARDDGFAHVILDGKIIARDRCKEPALSMKGQVIDLWYSGKAHAHGGNIQAVLAPDAFPLWISPAEPGSVHDITAARTHALPALYHAAADLPTLADPGYDGAASASTSRPDSQHKDSNSISTPALARPSSVPVLPARTRVRSAHRPLAYPPPHHRQSRQNRGHRPRRARADPFRVHLHHLRPEGG